MSNVALFHSLVGENFNQYHLKRMIGSGGFGAVYRANEVIRDQVTRQVAVKLIISDDNDPQQLQELIAATQLKHPNLLDCYVAGECVLKEIKFLYLVMELASCDLYQMRHGMRENQEMSEVLRAVASALLYLRSSPRNRVHQDIKPSNILWVKDKNTGDIGTWKVADFGLVRNIGKEAYANTSNPVGTIAYMPPESFDGKVGYSWDIWSLGITTLEVLTGEIPYEFTSVPVLMKRAVEGNPIIPNTLPPLYDQIVRGCLIRDYNQRWTAQSVFDALTSRHPVPARRPPRDFPWRWLAIIGIGTAILVPLVIWISRNPLTPPIGDPPLPPKTELPQPKVSNISSSSTPSFQQPEDAGEAGSYYPPKLGVDSKGNVAKLDIRVLSKEYAWQIESETQVQNRNTKKLGDLNLLNPALKSSFSNQPLLGTISIGAASCEGVTIEEEVRAFNRAENLQSVVRDMANISSKKFKYDYLLSLGQYRPCKVSPDPSTTADQRRIIIIGITDVKEVNGQINMEEALKDRLDKTPISNLRYQDYTKFNLKL